MAAIWSYLEICHPRFSHFVQKNFTHSFWLNLMMAAILNSAMLDSDTAILDSNTLLSSLRFTQKHSSSTLTLTQTNSIWLTRLWQPSWILPSWIQPFCTKLWLKLVQLTHSLTQLDDRQPSWILPCWICHWIQSPCYLLSDSLENTLTPLWPWLQLIQSDYSLNDGNHLEFCHLDSAILHKTLTQTGSIWLKPIHSDSTWWWQQSLICIQPSKFFLSITHTCHWLPLKKTFTDSFWLNLMMAAILNSAMLDSDTAMLYSDTLLSSIRITQKHSPSTLTLTQTNSIWLTRWWQPSWILPFGFSHFAQTSDSN